MDRVAYYGLTKVENPKQYLYFIPLVLTVSVNLWNGLNINNTPGEIVCHILTMVNVGFIEEIVFRGLIYKHLKRAMPVWLAVLIQALLFAVAHGQLLWMTYTFVLGAIFALLYDYFDSLWPCILAHLIFNGSNYLPFLETLTLEPIGWVIVMLASLLLCALTLLLLVIYRTLIERSPARHV